MQMGRIGELAGKIGQANGSVSQDLLEIELAKSYEPLGLAAMVVHRYPAVPVIQDYQATIAEAVEAHFCGLHHVAVVGLAPVVEGAGRRLAQQRGIERKHIKDVFLALTEACKEDRVGAVEEVDSMMDSFLVFARTYFFAKSEAYPFADGTNRHGIAHGAFSDQDYGRPLNFFKTIAAIDFLTFIASLKASVSWFAPDITEVSLCRASYYSMLQGVIKAAEIRASSSSAQSMWRTLVRKV